jgi:16S rRNA (adenine1518-N6/adenine1519-N6)-dimethyltransferase
MSLSDLPPLGAVIAAHGLSARKSFGQHFLLDLNLTRKIARAAQVHTVATVVEIGPGPGGLTRALLLEGAPHVIVVEKDQRFIAALQGLAEAAPGRLDIMTGDALAVELGALGASPRMVVANLPYNISTPILVALLQQVRAWHSLTLMFQKEVAQRLVAAPRTPAYGRLSVLAQVLCRTERLFDIPASAFVPPPKVVSTVVRLTPRQDTGQNRGVLPLKTLETLTAAAFGQRRKMLRTSLKAAVPDPDALLQRANIDGTRRAEELTPQDYVQLAALLAEMFPCQAPQCELE